MPAFRFALLAMILGCTAFGYSQTMHATHLRTEYLENPIGIGETSPRFSWWCESSKRGDMQTAYRILVASSRDMLEKNEGDLWDTGVVKSNETNQVAYAGKPLASRQEAWWKVMLWDASGKEGSVSKPATFEMGLLQPSDWQAKWIGLHIPGEADEKHPIPAGPAPYVRHEFSVDKPVRAARVYATARGLYELFIDGKRVGHDVFDPGFTDYRHRIQYQTFDVTSLLSPGNHAIGAILGDGWYCGHVGWGGRNNYGKQAMGLFQLELEHPDGSRETIASGLDWTVATGPILSSDMMMGEQYDARKELKGWNRAVYHGSGWEPVYVEDLTPEPVLEARSSEPVAVWHELHPRSISEPKPGQFVFDLGQNMVGWARLKVQGKAGDKVTLRFAEMLNPDGTIYTTNLRKAAATDEYTLKGGDAETYEPSFTFHGFRYVEVTGYPGTPTADAITGMVAGSAMPVTGSFECSNALVNQLQHNIYWGQRGNYLSIPTDCPQRDERLGWMGDAEVFIRTATFNCDVAAFMTKWMNDVQDGQSPEGGFADVSPRIYVGDGAPAWGDAGVIVPWAIYEAYGDKRILERHDNAMKKWVDYIHSFNPNLIWQNHRNNDYGDWLNIDAETQKDLLATAFFAHSTDIVARTAALLGRAEDANKYRQLFEGIRAAFQKEYISPDGSMKADTQTAYLLALGFDLMPQELSPAAAKLLVDNIMNKRHGHLSTGFLGVRLLNPVLTSMGYTDVAYKLLLNDTFPSWGYSIRQGATTIWERWDGYTKEKGFQDPGMNSFNHYSLGSVGEWIYSVVGGIRSSSPGYGTIEINPIPGGGITWAKTRYESIRGPIACSWSTVKGFSMDVTIPSNTTALVFVPAASGDRVTIDGKPASSVPDAQFVRMENGRAVFKVGGGSYHFSGG